MNRDRGAERANYTLHRKLEEEFGFAAQVGAGQRLIRQVVALTRQRESIPDVGPQLEKAMSALRGMNVDLGRTAKAHVWDRRHAPRVTSAEAA